MGEAVQNLVVPTSVQFGSTRRKARRTTRTDRYTGNLLVFADADAQSQRSTLTEHTVEKDCAPEHPNTCDVEDGFTNESTECPTHAGSNSSPRPRIDSPSAPTARRKKIGVAILLSLTSGVIISSIWTSTAKKPSAVTISQKNSDEPLVPEVFHIESIPQTDSEPVVSEANPTESELVAGGKIVDEKLKRIESLHAQNKDLLTQVNTLSSESIELTNELLRLERSLAALKTQSEPIIETKTVYNFVNVPIGNDFVPQNATNTWQGESEQDKMYYESQQYSDDQYNYEEEELLTDEGEQRYYDNQEQLYGATEDSYNYYAPNDQQQPPLENIDQYSAEGQAYYESEDAYDDDPQNLIPYE